MAKIWERLKEGTNGTDITKTDTYLNTVMFQAADLLEEAERVLKEARFYLEPPQAGTIIQNRVDALLTRIREEQ